MSFWSIIVLFVMPAAAFIQLITGGDAGQALFVLAISGVAWMFRLSRSGGFGSGNGEVRRALERVTPGLGWRVGAFAGDSSSHIFFAALPASARGAGQALGSDQAERMVRDVGSALKEWRADYHVEIGVEADDGTWKCANAVNGGVTTYRAAPPAFAELLQ